MKRNFSRRAYNTTCVHRKTRIILMDLASRWAHMRLTNLDVFSNSCRRKRSIYHYPLHEYDVFRLHSESVRDSIHTDQGMWWLMWTAYLVSPSNSIDASIVIRVSARERKEEWISSSSVNALCGQKLPCDPGET